MLRFGGLQVNFIPSQVLFHPDFYHFSTCLAMLVLYFPCKFFVWLYNLLILMMVLSAMYLELLGLERGADPITAFNSVRLNIICSYRSMESEPTYDDRASFLA